MSAQNHNEGPPHTHQDGYHVKEDRNNEGGLGPGETNFMHCDENVKWYGQCASQYGSSSKKLKIELLYDLAIPLWGIHSKELKDLKYLHSHVHSSIFTKGRSNPSIP